MQKIKVTDKKRKKEVSILKNGIKKDHSRRRRNGGVGGGGGRD